MQTLKREVEDITTRCLEQFCIFKEELQSSLSSTMTNFVDSQIQFHREVFLVLNKQY